MPDDEAQQELDRTKRLLEETNKIRDKVEQKFTPNNRAGR
jgi:hypothetical protein